MGTQILLNCLLMTTVRDHDVEELGKCKGTVTMRDIVFISYFPESVGLAKKTSLF